MYYHLVWVRSNRYHGHEPLTYASTTKLSTGRIVQVELQRELVLGVVSGTVSEPRFQTKPVARVYDLPVIPLHLLRVSQWLLDYYPAPLGILTQQLIPASFSEKLLLDKQLVAPTEPNLEQLPPLTVEQQQALEAMQARTTYLLHGVTGSGKTRLYVELTAQAISRGRSAIILTPEISLTTQLAATFAAVFGSKRIIVMHSQQAPGERQTAWLLALRAEQPMIVIGPRSALFSPVQKLGLIVLDEAHEAAYKQEQAPQYQTTRVASYLAPLAHAQLVLGSATPAVSEYYIAQQKQKPIITLASQAKPERLAATEVVTIDLKDRSVFSRSQLFSEPLLKAIESSLMRHEQSLLYLNRRGTARLVMCENCGWQALCPHCDLPLTYHGDTHQLRCHSCDHHQTSPSSCPVCHHADILFKSAGTKAVVAEIEKLFPDARVARFDTDNVKAERFEQHYESVRSGNVDILVGTQLLAKGLDLPKLSTLGVLLADTSLYLPDFSASERTFQLIRQVLGRVGRGHVAGKAIIQTYHPDHPVLKDAIAGDYQAFYSRELAERQQFFFPPFCHLLKLSCRRVSSSSAEAAAAKLKTTIEHGGYSVRVEGPAPSFYEHIQGKYQWQLVVKAVARGELLRIIADLPSNWSYDIDPADLL